MLDGENKDLTMESDFLGMFNPVRGLKKKENSGSNPESPSLTVENLAPLLINALDNHADYRDALKAFTARQDSALKPLFVTDCDFLKNKLSETDLISRADQALQNNDYVSYNFLKLFIEKFQSLGECNKMLINAQSFSETKVEVYFNIDYTDYDPEVTEISVYTANILNILDSISHIDNTLAAFTYLKEIESTGLDMLDLTGEDAIIGVDTTSPDNLTYIEGDVPVNSNVFIDGLNKLTGTYNNNSKSFSIYINDVLYTTIPNVNKWGYKLEIFFNHGIDHIVYPNSSFYQKTNETLPDNLKGFNNQYFIASVEPIKPEIILNKLCLYNIEILWFFGNIKKTALLLNIKDLDKAVYYCADNNNEYGLYKNIVIKRNKRIIDDCLGIINNTKLNINIDLGL